MKIVKIEWRNIFSYGNKVETLDFSDSSMLWLISGKSGSGKTSLLSMPKLLLYGKTEGSDGSTIKTGSVANRVNKHGWIRGEICVGKDNFVIERTFSPQTLRVWKNGEDLDKAGLKDMQGIIDNEILDNMPYHIFSNVMTVSLNNFKSFISMTPADKREIIDRIFNLEIINKIHELVKKDMKDLGNVINLSNSKLFAFEQTIKSSSNELSELESRHVDGNKEELAELRDKIERTKNMYAEQSAIYTEQYTKCEQLVQGQTELIKLKYARCADCNATQQKINLFKEDKCPTCGTPFNGGDFDELRIKLERTYEEQYNLYMDAENQLKQTEELMKKYGEVIAAIKSNMDKIYAKQQELLVRVGSIEKAASMSDEYKSIQRIIDETERNKSCVETEISEYTRRMELLTVIENMYSSDGIKRELMETYIPSLNEEIANTLTALGFPYTLEFDSNFDPHLEDMGDEISPSSLSIGEHKKVDLTVLCAIVRMLKRTYPQINLICLDETVSSLDYESSTDIIVYLKDLAVSMGLNIFIVSHTQLEESLFDRKIFIDKNAKFSELRYV